MQPSTSTPTSLPESAADAWQAIEYPFTVQELKRLVGFRMAVGAHQFMEAEHEPVDMKVARRLAFHRWRFITNRLSEHTGKGLSA